MDIQSLFGVKNLCVLVTGGSRGLGEHIAEGFVANGARVYISSRKKAVCDKIAEELSAKYKGVCISLPADLSTLQGVDSLVSQLSKHETYLDVLVNNAGAGWRQSYETFPENGWDKIFNINLKGLFFLTQRLTPHLKRSFQTTHQRSRVINIASVEGFSAEIDETYSYAASKAGVIHLTKVLGRRLAVDGINVTAIAPGAFPSDMNPTARDHADSVRMGIPADRVGDKYDMAGCCIFLASKAGSYVLGDTIVLDGGLVHSGPWPLRPAAAARGKL